MRNTLDITSRSRRHAGVIAAFAVLLASCGGADSPEMAAQQRDEAAALQHAMTLAKTANAAKVRGERAKAAAVSQAAADK